MSSPDQFLCPEDLHTGSASPEASAFDEGCSTSQSSPPPVIVQSKHAKKRKSWGQELPEPKTSLPPRKRAKTDDEKEQRRIERIKRNRAAAHNSRERKRQETETLAVALARANAELAAYRKLHGDLPKHIVLPEIHVQSDSPEAETPTPSLVHDAMSPPSPAESIFHHDSIKQEQSEHSYPLTNLPPAFDNLDSKSSLLSPLDPTQHSAVSVQPPEQQHDFEPYGMVGQPPRIPDGYAMADMLQDPHGGHVDSFAFSDGGFDASFSTPLDFSFDDFVQDSASFVVDAQASGAV